MPAMSVYVIGASGHGKVVIATLQAAGVAIAGVLDDDPAKHGLRILGVPVPGPAEMAIGSEHAVVIAVGSNATRKRIADFLNGRVAWSTAVHPEATVHPSVKIGEGTVVFAGTVIQPDTVIGGHVIINTAATVDHDCRVADYVHVAPGVRVAGDVRLGEGVFMGVGACTIQGVHVGEWATLGAGAVAIRNVPAGVTAVGVPARSL
jgi:sugar O-acyltransferase (sialic acid O-acetyltransferase NeuD family)